jgi:hypothetical protein
MALQQSIFIRLLFFEKKDVREKNAKKNVLTGDRSNRKAKMT